MLKFCCNTSVLQQNNFSVLDSSLTKGSQYYLLLTSVIEICIIIANMKLKQKSSPNKTILVGVIIILLIVLFAALLSNNSQSERKAISEKVQKPTIVPTPILSPDERIIYKYIVQVTAESVPDRALFIDVSETNKEKAYTVPQKTIIRLKCNQVYSCPHNRIIITPTKGVLEIPDRSFSSPNHTFGLFEATGPGEATIIITQ